MSNELDDYYESENWSWAKKNDVGNRDRKLESIKKRLTPCLKNLNNPWVA